MPVQQTINLNLVETDGLTPVVTDVNISLINQSTNDFVSYTKDSPEITLTSSTITINSSFGDTDVICNIAPIVSYNGNTCTLASELFIPFYIPNTVELIYNFDAGEFNDFDRNDNITQDFDSQFTLVNIENPNGLQKKPIPESGSSSSGFANVMGFTDANRRYDTIFYGSRTDYGDDRIMAATAIQSDFPPLASGGVGSGNLTVASKLMSSQIDARTVGYIYSNVTGAGNVPLNGIYTYTGDFGVPTSITGYLMIGYNQGQRYSSFTSTIEDLFIEGSNDNIIYTPLPINKPTFPQSLTVSSVKGYLYASLKVDGTIPYRYYRITYQGRFFTNGFNGAFLTPLPSYDTSKVNYITTNINTQQDISALNQLVFNPNQSTNINTDIYYLFSFDGGVNWGVFTDPNTFVTKTNDLDTYDWDSTGNSMEESDLVTTFDITSYNTLDYAIGLRSRNRNETPTLDQLIITLKP